jgi:transposase-like protein
VRDEQLLREWIRLVIERNREKRHKPGGPRTDAGALRQLNPDAFKTKVRTAVRSKGGDVKSAARAVGVAPRTLYGYLDDEPALQQVKTKSEIETASESGRDETPEEERKFGGG